MTLVYVCQPGGRLCGPGILASANTATIAAYRQILPADIAGLGFAYILWHGCCIALAIIFFNAINALHLFIVLLV